MHLLEAIREWNTQSGDRTQERKGQDPGNNGSHSTEQWERCQDDNCPTSQGPLVPTRLGRLRNRFFETELDRTDDVLWRLGWGRNEATGKANLFKERNLLSLKMYSNNVNTECCTSASWHQSVSKHERFNHACRTESKCHQSRQCKSTNTDQRCWKVRWRGDKRKLSHIVLSSPYRATPGSDGTSNKGV